MVWWVGVDLAHHVRKKMRFSASFLWVHLSVFDNWMWHCVHRCCGWLQHRCCGVNCQSLTNCGASVHGWLPCVGGCGVCCICSCGVCGGAIGVNFGAVVRLCVLMRWHSALIGLLIRLSYRFDWGCWCRILGDVPMGCLLGGIGGDAHFLFFFSMGCIVVGCVSLWWRLVCVCAWLGGVLAWAACVGVCGGAHGRTQGGKGGHEDSPYPKARDISNLIYIYL